MFGDQTSAVAVFPAIVVESESDAYVLPAALDSNSAPPANTAIAQITHVARRPERALRISNTGDGDELGAGDFVAAEVDDTPAGRRHAGSGDEPLDMQRIERLEQREHHRRPFDGLDHDDGELA